MLQTSPMKKIEAVIKPFKLDAVQRALSEVGIGGMAVTEIKGFVRQRGRTDAPKSGSFDPTFLPKVKLEVVIGDSYASRVKDVILSSAKTGKSGDGKVFVSLLSPPCEYGPENREKQLFRP
jgi:nitrogen regulatory protein P-II 1